MWYSEGESLWLPRKSWSIEGAVDKVIDYLNYKRSAKGLISIKQ